MYNDRNSLFNAFPITDVMTVLFMVALIVMAFMLLFKFLFKRNELVQATSEGEGRDELVTGRENQ